MTEEQKAYDLAVENHERAMARVAELERELAALKAQPGGVVLPDRDEVVRKAFDLCSLIPGSTTWNAAEYAYDEFAARLNQQPASGGVDERALWAVHVQGSDDLYAAFSREDAERCAADLNDLPMPEGISVSAVVTHSPWAAAEHWKCLAEQERDHKQEIIARSLAQSERVPASVGADDVRGACQDAIEVFSEQPDADQCREVAEYMREVLLAIIARREQAAAPSPSKQGGV